MEFVHDSALKYNTSVWGHDLSTSWNFQLM